MNELAAGFSADERQAVRKMSKLNWKIIAYNIIEAREQLEEIERLIKTSSRPSEVELQVMLEHAFHHLSFAWNARRVTSNRYSNSSDADFNAWGKFPMELEEYQLESTAK